MFLSFGFAAVRCAILSHASIITLCRPPRKGQMKTQMGTVGDKMATVAILGLVSP